MAHLFEPLEVRGVRFRNRIFVSSMCQYSSKEGRANDWHFVHLGCRAVGGAALVMAEAAAVLPEGRISPDDLGIWNDSQVESLAPIFAFIERQGAVAGMQLAHAGRKAGTAVPWEGERVLSEAEGGWRPVVAPSPLPFADGYPVPEPLDEGGIQRVVRAFADSAGRALQAGAKVLEIHSAHGYLLHSFLSPLSNQRSDNYGGCLPNRIRIVCQVVEAVRQVWPERHPLSLRISASDWVEDGWTVEDSVALARQVKDLGVDLIDCSSGGIRPRIPIPLGPGYQVPFAEKIRREAAILTTAVGMITAPQQADQIIRTGQADAVLLARELLRDPYWPLRAAHELRQEVAWPKQYLRAKPV